MIEETRQGRHLLGEAGGEEPSRCRRAGKEAGLVRLGIKKNNGNGDEQSVRV